jgi:S1-C subfamily serine protease
MQLVDFPARRSSPALEHAANWVFPSSKETVLRAAVAVLACAIGWSSASVGWGQVSTVPRAAAPLSSAPQAGPGVQPRRAAKPVVDGQTYVALDQTLDHVYNGWAPQSLEELRALEDQQSKVAAAIQKVTVNVRQGVAQGSGVLIRDGYVLTAAHVGGKPKREATIVLNDGTELKAEVLGMNRNVDAGLL